MSRSRDRRSPAALLGLVPAGILLLSAASWWPASGQEVPPPRQGATVHPVELESEGLTLKGRFFQAPGPEPHATLLLIHGWPGNDRDVLGMGRRLSGMGVNVVMVHPRGMHGSQGRSTFHGALRDIGNAYRWLQGPEARERFGVDPDRLVLGGYSWGGGMALAHAATDPEVRRVISIAGTDHGVFIRQYDRDEAFRNGVRATLLASRAPEGPIRFELETTLRELREGQAVFGLRENAPALADRSILILGGWYDTGPTIDEYQLPLFRALEAEGARDVRFLTYHDDHAFAGVRDEMAADMARWIRERVGGGGS